MKRLSINTLSLICGLALLVAGTSVWGAGKIAPSRSLKGSGNETGTLSVFSEPPDQPVTLDGAIIGSTPVIKFEVKAGSHILRIGESETEIDIIPNKPLNLSWHRGTFIEVANQEKSETQQQQEVKKKKPQKQQTADSKKDDPKLEPLYWPLNPTGPIY